MAEVVTTVNNSHEDNYDEHRFGKEVQRRKPSHTLKSKAISAINKQGFYNDFNNHLFSKQLGTFDFPFTDFIHLYNLLEDKSSKDLLIKIVAYRLLGHKKVKLPLNTPDYWQNLRMVEEHQSKVDIYPMEFRHMKFPMTDLGFLGLPIRMYSSALGINIDFIIKQYELHRNEVQIQAEEGETVIDGGGCYGDTALYFANKIGSNGKVYSFEFIPDNIELFNKNIQLNPRLTSQIELIDRPLWSQSGDDLYYLSNGPASIVLPEVFDGYTGQTSTLTIDDLVSQKSLQTVDFIKLDIEGAELSALRGAINTLKSFRPKLAVALYHKTEDFNTIPRFISELDLGYKFYLSHATIHAEETMLFAKMN